MLALHSSTGVGWVLRMLGGGPSVGTRKEGAAGETSRRQWRLPRNAAYAIPHTRKLSQNASESVLERPDAVIPASTLAGLE